MTEASLRHWLTKLLRNKPILLQPIESGGTGLGIPDVYFRTERSGGWIELKIGTLSVMGEVKIRWEPGQLNWIKRHACLRGRTFLFIGVESNMVVILCLNNVCSITSSRYNNIDPLIESADYAGPMDLVSSKYIMSVLDS